MLVLVIVLASLRRACKSGRRKHKHKRKERKLKHSNKLSAYIQVTHALPLSAMLESNFARLPQLFILLRLRTVCHLMLIVIARVNILALMLVLMLMLASHV